MNDLLSRLDRPNHLWVAAILFLAVACVPNANAQSGDAKLEQKVSAVVSTSSTPAAFAPMSALKGIKIGMTADDAIKLLGKPEASDARGMYFELSNGEAMQLAIDDAKTITTLSMTYNGKDANAPEFVEVFGKEVKAETQENGSVFHRVRYPDLGIWIAYSRLGEKDSPMTTVTIQKIDR